MPVKRFILVITILLLICLPGRSIGQTLLEQGILAFNMDDFVGAADYISRYIDTNPYSQQAYEYLVNAYLALGQSRDALRTLETAVRYFPDIAEFYKLMGRLYTQQEDYEKARESLEKYLKLSPGDIEAESLLSTICFNCGVISAQRSDYFPAIEYFDRAIELDSSYMEAYQNKTALLIEVKDFQQAQHDLEKARKRFPYNDIFDKAYFDILVRQEKYREALPIMESISEREPENIDLALQLGILYRYLNEIEKAMSLYDNLIKKHPRERKIYEAVIEYWSNFNRQDKIRQTYELMLEAFPDDIEIEKEIAGTYERDNKWSEARDQYDKLIETHPRRPEFYLLKANTYRKQDSLPEAIVTLEQVLRFDNKNYAALKKLGSIYESENNISRTLEIYRKMYDYYSEDYHSAYHFGLAYLNSDMLDSAEVYLTEAKNISSSEASPYFALGQVAVKRGNSSDAAAMFKEALSRAIKRMSHLQEEARSSLSSEDTKLRLDQLSKYESMQNRIELNEYIIESSLDYLKENYSHRKYGDLLTGYLRLYPSSIFLHLYQAQWFNKDNKPGMVKESYKKVISLNPEVTEAHLGLAKCYENENDYDKAIKSYNRALTIEDDNITAYDSIIRIYTEQNRLDELADKWLANYRMKPENEFLRERLLEVLHKTGRTDEAKRLIESVKDKASENE